VHVTVLPATQAPAWHATFRSHWLLSTHDVPSLTGTGVEQVPVPDWHVPGVLHWSPLVQTTGLVPVHAPP
jgi:hypothetical protein